MAPTFTPTVPSAKFPTIGTSIAGTVIGITESEVPAFNAKGRIEGVQKDDDGNPITQLDVTLATPTGKVVVHTGGAIFHAINRALGEIGSESLDEGDTLAIEYTGDGEPTAKGRNAPKQYAATITKA